jgi:hypothetical protein
MPFLKGGRKDLNPVDRKVDKDVSSQINSFSRAKGE